MNAPETTAVVGPILAVAVGGGLIKRDQQAWGAVLVVLGVGAAVALLVLGNTRPIVGLVAFAGLVGGFVADERGRRGVGLAGIGVGFFALLIAYFYA
jgi:hypothetical protein